MPFVEVERGRLYYEAHGPAVGSAPVIVFAHGAGGNHLSWWQQVPHSRARYTCVTFDHRGFGQSCETAGGPGGTAFVDDLRALLDHLAATYFTRARFTRVAQAGHSVYFERPATFNALVEAFLQSWGDNVLPLPTGED